jgi:hypothetical protein
MRGMLRSLCCSAQARIRPSPAVVGTNVLEDRTRKPQPPRGGLPGWQGIGLFHIIAMIAFGVQGIRGTLGRAQPLGPSCPPREPGADSAPAR